MIHHYFVAKSIRLLKENGLLAMVVPCYILDNPKRHLRKQMSEVAELIATYRLPENLFDDAKVTVDVVIFQRTNTPQKNWIDSQEVAFANGNHLHMTNYFVDHPNHVIGKLGTYEAHSFFEDKPRQGLKCIAPLEEVKKRTSELIQTLRPLVE